MIVQYLHPVASAEYVRIFHLMMMMIFGRFCVPWLVKAITEELILWSSVLLDKLIIAQPAFYKPRSSSPCSQELAVSPYPEPEQSRNTP
jgi:hypothetical protein